MGDYLDSDFPTFRLPENILLVVASETHLPRTFGQFVLVRQLQTAFL